MTQAREASDYVKAIAEKAVADLRAKEQAAAEQLKQEIDS